MTTRYQRANKFGFNKNLKDVILPSFLKKSTPQVLKPADVKKITQAARTKSPDTLISTIFEIAELRWIIEEKLCSSLSQCATDLKNRSSSNEYISQLAKTEYEPLETFDWASIMKEMVEKTPLLLRIMVAVALERNSHKEAMIVKDEDNIIDRIIAIVPKLCTVYSILMQTRNPSLCRLQQSLSFCLHDNVEERKLILNHLNQMGVSISYDDMMDAIKSRQNHINNKTSSVNGLGHLPTVNRVNAKESCSTLALSTSVSKGKGKVPLINEQCNTTTSEIMNAPSTVNEETTDHPYVSLLGRARRKIPIKDESKTVRSNFKSKSKKKVSLVKDDTSVALDVFEHDAIVHSFPTQANVSCDVALSEYKLENNCDTMKTEYPSQAHDLNADCFEMSSWQETCEKSSTVIDDLNTISVLSTTSLLSLPESEVLENSMSESLRQSVEVQGRSKPRRKARAIRNIAHLVKSLGGTNNQKHGPRKNFNKSISSDVKGTLDFNQTNEKMSKICHVCGKIFKTKLACKNHCRSHTSEKLFTCEICGKAFAAKRDLNEHSRIHTGECPYQCEQCGRSFKASGVFAKHRRYHASTSHDSSCFTCPKCNKIMPMKSARSHMDSQCLSNECDQCHRVFSRPDSLALHKNVAHAGKLGYTCPVCDRQFAWSANLRIHMKRHRRVENSNESEQPPNKPVGCYRQRKGNGQGQKKKAEGDKQLGIVKTPSVWTENIVEKVS